MSLVFNYKKIEKRFNIKIDPLTHSISINNSFKQLSLVIKHQFFKFYNNKLFIGKNFLNFYKYLIIYLIKSLYITFYKQLQLEGIGFKIFITKKLNLIRLDLGFSHALILNFPLNTFIRNKGSNILVYGLAMNAVYNLSQKLRYLRKINVYKLKGIRYKSEMIKLKPGKQKT